MTQKLFIFFAFNMFLISCFSQNRYQNWDRQQQGQFSGYCDFSPFIKAGRVSLHRRSKAVFYVARELKKPAKEAAHLLSNHIGIDLFEIRDIREDDDRQGSEIYIASDEAHYEREKERVEPGSFLAYCKIKENYDKDTGEMYESDIVFNPIIYDRERYNLEIYKRLGKNAIEEAQDRVRYDEQRIFDYCDRAINKEECHRELRDAIEDQQERLEDIEDNMEDDLDELEEAIYEDVLKTMIHELGHSLGYSHTPQDTENIMYNTDRYGGSVLTGRQVNAVLCSFRLPSNLLF